ncbi:arylformamidase [Virgibacillus natechei]|uniref:Arylformamidase n=1 Tax=Virgibacillus natechei TaxID=1216297 RepID=A0ABS4IKS7_9BACI|nr:cyclase family protein [Virgibacillus natechei]MBP1971519.1 arylformamidase [Virgibacillus natechei]UZD12562.1 cyclase family protein [Virgibacillus natechei]
MKMYDVTATIFEGMPTYKNKQEKQPKLNTVTNGHVTESRMDIDLHTGTHIDSPLHMINDGDTMETIQMEDLVRQAKLFDLTHVEDRITKKDIEGFSIEKDDFVLFQTKNSFEGASDYEFIFVAEDAASYLAEIGITGVGVDGLGIERSQEGHPTHRSLFQHNVIVIEGLRLAEVPEGEYFMVAAPLKLEGTDAAPARILLFEGLSVT